MLSEGTCRRRNQRNSCSRWVKLTEAAAHNCACAEFLALESLCRANGRQNSAHTPDHETHLSLTEADSHAQKHPSQGTVAFFSVDYFSDHEISPNLWPFPGRVTRSISTRRRFLPVLASKPSRLSERVLAEKAYTTKPYLVSQCNFSAHRRANNFTRPMNQRFLCCPRIHQSPALTFELE